MSTALQRWCGWVVLAWLLAGCGSAPQAPRQITLAGIVVDAQRVARPDETGLVQVNRDGRWIEARADMALQKGDWVSTGPRAYALIRYPSGSELFMRPDTRGRIGTFSELVGEVFAKIRGAFAVQTTFVSAGAEGTAYSVRASQDGQYTLVVYDGSVRLSSLSGSWPAVTLGRGAMTTGRPQVPPHATPAAADELAHTHDWVERVEKLLPRPPGSSVSAGKVLAIGALVAIIAAAAASGSSRDLDAPSDLAPAGRSAQDPALPRSCRPLQLSWRAVSGARDYLVTLEPLSSAHGPSADSATRSTDTPSLSLPGGLRGLYRWHVQARDGRGKTGPASPPSHFHCRG
jgi:hypothetical protein